MRWAGLVAKEDAAVRLVAYSDIHFCDTHKLVTLEDVVAVHRRLNEYVRQVQPDAVLFLGDRFRARQPKDHVRAAADECLLELSQVAKRVIVVRGNHDNYSESVGSGDTYSAIRTFAPLAMPNVVVVDKPQTLEVPGCSFHCLPSGFGYHPENYLVGQGLNVFLYHGMVSGAIEFVKKGIPLEVLDRPEYDLVLCGDVHTPIVFKTKFTKGGYVGSTLRLTEADAGDMRGWVDVTLEPGKTPVCTTIEGDGPQFHKLVLSPDRATWPAPEPFAGGVILATLKGKPAELRPHTNEAVRAAFPGAKYVEVHRDYEHEVISLVQGIAADTPAVDDMAAYIQATDRGGLDLSRLVEKARAIAQSSPERKGLFA